MSKARPYERMPQVLRLLLKHGPLSTRGLAACLSPPPGRRALRYVLKRLYDQGLLARREEKGSGRIYHQITQDPAARPMAASILKVPLELIEQPQFRHAELLHSEDCAIWCELLSELFPEAQVRRDFQFAALKEAQSLLLSRFEERDLLPDLLLTIPARDGRGSVSVAVEIERTVKSGKRLLRKLRRYADQTRIDGLIYVCSSDAIQRKLLEVYVNKVAARALRISHYAENFFLFADGSASCDFSEPQMFNADGKSVSLKTWIRILAETKSGGRRDSIFQHRSSGRNDVFQAECSHSDPKIVGEFEF